ncbi:MAG: 50S ribosomal protein L27 [bacterium]
MATKKAGGSAKNLTDSNPQYLGIKLYAGERAQTGSIIVRQRGTKIMAGKNVGVGKDHTLYATAPGVVAYTEKRKVDFDNKVSKRKVANVVGEVAKVASKKAATKVVAA